MYEIFEQLLQSNGTTAYQVAKATGIAQSTLSDWKKGRSVPKMDKMQKIADYFGVSVSYLLGNEEKPTSNEGDGLPFGLEFYKPKGQMPILGRVAAGLPMYAEENIIGYCANDFTDDEVYYALTVHGDSMNAAGIDDGDLVVVRQQPTVDDGQVAVVLVDGQEATIKYFRQQGDVVVLAPKSYNPIHQPQIYNIKEIPVRVIGRVVQVRKMI